MRRGVKGGAEKFDEFRIAPCFGCLQFAKCNFFSFHESDLRSRIAERKPKDSQKVRWASWKLTLRASPYQNRGCRRSQQEWSDRPILFGE